MSASREATSGGDGTRSNNALADSGAVYVFERNAGAWSQVAYLKSTNADTKYHFGSALALQSKTLLVGAQGEDRTSKPASGAAYLFERNAAGWSLQKRITAANAESNDGFGSAVALSSTLMAIGALGEASDAKGVNGDSTSNRTPFSGAVYLYER